MNTAILVLIINKNKNEFLSVSCKKDHTDFNLPGGKVEHNETYIEAGIREVKEETGIDVYNLHYLYKDLDNDFEVITYYTFDYQGNIYTNENHIVKWLPIYDLNKSKKWYKYNSMIYNKYIDLKL
jgi:8-oxo-dGTP diphosphatase